MFNFNKNKSEVDQMQEYILTLSNKFTLSDLSQLFNRSTTLVNKALKPLVEDNQVVHINNFNTDGSINRRNKTYMTKELAKFKIDAVEYNRAINEFIYREAPDKSFKGCLRGSVAAINLAYPL